MSSILKQYSYAMCIFLQANWHLVKVKPAERVNWERSLVPSPHSCSGKGWERGQEECMEVASGLAALRYIQSCNCESIKTKRFHTTIQIGC